MGGRLLLVVPAKAGTHGAAAETIGEPAATVPCARTLGDFAGLWPHAVLAARWTPAFAGVTGKAVWLRHRRIVTRRRGHEPFPPRPPRLRVPNSFPSGRRAREVAMHNGILLGCVADDMTGATDLANTLVREGMRTVQMIGVPAPDIAAPDTDAVVVALKSRTIPARQAVEQSLAALAWLRPAGARQYFFKYCSTFDSTDQGNIGPVADALLAALGAD